MNNATIAEKEAIMHETAGCRSKPAVKEARMEERGSRPQVARGSTCQEEKVVKAAGVQSSVLDATRGATSSETVQ